MAYTLTSLTLAQQTTNGFTCEWTIFLDRAWGLVWTVQSGLKCDTEAQAISLLWVPLRPAGIPRKDSCLPSYTLVPLSWREGSVEYYAMEGSVTASANIIGRTENSTAQLSMIEPESQSER